MTSPLPDHVRAFLDDLRFATIATIDPDGAPRQAVVWYRARRRRDRHQQRRWVDAGRRTCCATRGSRSRSSTATDGYRWVGLTGTVRAITDQATAQADIAAMARRYHADDPDEAERLIRDRFERQERVSFRFRPAAVHDHLDE